MLTDEQEIKLLMGKLSVSEISDANCRQLLRTLVRRHGQHLLQLQAQYNNTLQATPNIELVVKEPENE